MKKPIEITLRTIVPCADVDALLGPLEWTADKVHLSPTQSGQRATFRGVPARRVDVVVVDGYALRHVSRTETTDSPVCIVEVGRKAGKYDGAERDRITIRPWQRAQAREIRAAGADAVQVTGEETATTGRLIVRAGRTVDIEVGTVDGSGWERSYGRLRWEPDAAIDAGRVILWHWTRYYRHLREADARDLASTWTWPPEAPSWVQSAAAIAAGMPEDEARAPRPVTLAEANRAASRALYDLSRQLGWRKLTLRERERLGLVDHGQWCDEATYAERQAALAGCRAPGAGEATPVAVR